VLHDGDGDGQVLYPDDVVGESAEAGAREEVALAGLRPGGHYEAWVHGFRVPGDEGLADLTLDVIDGDELVVKNVPGELKAGQPAAIGLCPKGGVVLREGGRAVLLLGPGSAPHALRADVAWQVAPRVPQVFLPLQINKSYWPYQ
jgi:hypothetical protein